MTINKDKHYSRKLTLVDVDKARSNTPIDYYRRDADTLDEKAYKAFVNGSSFVLGVAFAGENIVVHSTKYARNGKTKRRYQVQIFLKSEDDQKLDQLCLYIPVWAYFKTEPFKVLSIDTTSVEGTDTFSVNAIQGSKHVRIASGWLIENNVCTIHTEWFTARFTYDPVIGVARFECENKEGSPMSKDRPRRARMPNRDDLIKTQISVTPDIKAALEKAAKAENSSASRLVYEILENHPLIAQHLDISDPE